MTTWPRQLPRDAVIRAHYLDFTFYSIAPKYELASRLLSVGQDRRWKGKLLAFLPPLEPGATVLDLATGSGAIPLLLRRGGFEGTIIGLDRNAAMMETCRARQSTGNQILLVRGGFVPLPFPGGSFEVVTMGYGLRYADSPRSVLREIRRVLKPGGTFVCMDFGVPRNRLYRWLCRGYLLLFGTLYGLLLHGRADAYWHIAESLVSHPGQHALARYMVEAGLTHVALREDLGGISVIASGVRPGHTVRRPLRCRPAIES
jgi:demethylmenaquinone methyltransferase / 2-methoxy-6-polyprenyl-1,4-benzoquinol methylase